MNWKNDMSRQYQAAKRIYDSSYNNSTEGKL